MSRTFEHNRHGWVIPNENGNVAKCGGPAACESCRADLEQQYKSFQREFNSIVMETPEYRDSLMHHKAQVMDATNKRNDELCKAALRYALDHFVGVIINPKEVPALSDVDYDTWYLVAKDRHGRLTITPTAANQLQHGTIIKVPSLG